MRLEAGLVYGCCEMFLVRVRGANEKKPILLIEGSHQTTETRDTVEPYVSPNTICNNVPSTTRSRRTCYVDHSDSLTTRHSGLRSPRTRPLHFPQLSHVSYRKHTSKLSHPSLSLTPTQPAQGWGLPARYSASGTTAPATARLGPHFLGGEAAREGAGERWGLRPALHHGAPPLLLDLGSKAPQILWQHRSLGE